MDLKPDVRELAPILREQRGRAVDAARTALAWRSARPWALAIVGASAFLTFAEAFGVRHAAPAVRGAYWFILLLCGSALAWLVRRALRRSLVLPQRPWFAMAVEAVVVAALLTGLVAGATELAFAGRHSLQDVFAYFAPVFAITLAMSAVRSLLRRASEGTTAPGAKPARPPFIERLPARFREAELHAIEAEDHYLRVHTSAGSTLLLMRFTDALAQLNGVDGAQTHRSWWVARGAIRGASPRFGRAVLHLPGGVKARVSRSYARPLRRAGWY